MTVQNSTKPEGLIFIKILDVSKLLSARILCCEEHAENEVFSVCGCDLMSDVLAYVKNQAVLVTGLVNPQVIRTAEMMDMKCVIFVRGKTPNDEIVSLAGKHGIVLLATTLPMFEACGILYSAGLRGRD